MLEAMNEKDFYKWLGSQFQTKREQKGLKQKEVAEKAEIAQGELSKFENKGKKLSAYRVLRLLRAIECSMDDLLGETDIVFLS
jgi:transcriptional regulator with XRE-family HTH domain